MREDETDAGLPGEAQFGHNGREIGAIGAQSVQPDDRKSGIFGGFDFDGREQFFHGRLLACRLRQGC
jgi:hypothetical protein